LEPKDIALDSTAAKLYFIASISVSPTNRIQRANLDGTDVEDLVLRPTTVPLTIALDVNGGKLYWTELSEVWRADLDGTNQELLITAADGIWGLAVDAPGGKVYWVVYTPTNGTVQRANLDGTGVESLVTFSSSLQSFGLDMVDGRLYWISVLPSLDTRLMRANLDGTGFETLASIGTFVFTTGLSIDTTGKKIFWTNLSPTNKVQRANLDGTGVEDVVSVFGDIPIGLAIDTFPPVPVPTVTTWGMTLLTLILMVAGTVVFRHRTVAVS
jgi:hypothetical protein